jgi:hypothetical protein
MKTQRDAILADLQSGLLLTHLEALRRYGCSRLAARVWELREQGWPIESTQETMPTAHGHQARVAVYRMGA